MGNLTFKMDENLRQIIAHSKSGSGWKIPYTDKVSPVAGLYLVHDDGVYLMSAASEPNPKSDTGTSQRVAHAKGCNPKSDPDSYETARCLVGGDDFAEFLPLEMFEGAVADGAKSVTLVLGARSIRIKYTKPKQVA